jgi:uncharacterized protein YggU (UPF0235/DUF167 family)
VLLRVRLTPRAAKDGIDGVKDAPDAPYVQARVRAVPEDGKANIALTELLAKSIGVTKSSISVSSGAASRLKTVLIAGDKTSLEKRLATWLEGLA